MIAPTLPFMLHHPAHFIALGFGAGLAPFAPGTFGTLVAIPIALLLQRYAGDMGFALAIVFLRDYPQYYRYFSQVSFNFRGRQITHPELGRDMLEKVAGMLTDVAVVEQSARLEGRHMSMMLVSK